MGLDLVTDQQQLNNSPVNSVGFAISIQLSFIPPIRQGPDEREPSCVQDLSSFGVQLPDMNQELSTPHITGLQKI